MSLAGHLRRARPRRRRRPAPRRRRCPPACLRSGRSLRAMSNESSLTPGSISSITPRSRIAGTKPRADALDLVRPGRAAGQHRRGGRLDGDHPHGWLARLQHLADAGDGAAGADAGDHRVHRARRCRSRSPRRWRRGGSAGLAGFSNCCGITEPGISSSSSRALATAPAMPRSAGVSSSLAPSSSSILRRSSDMLSGITRISFSPLAAATNARAMPVLPLVGSMIVVPSLDQPLGLQGLDHRDADAVLDRAQRVEELQLGDAPRPWASAGREPRQAHERACRRWCR